MARRAPPRIRADSITLEPADGRPGFCEVTSDSLGVGDCDEGSMGSVRVGHPDFGMITSLDKCASWCLHFCSRCNYVSFSLAANDCSCLRPQVPQLQPRQARPKMARDFPSRLAVGQGARRHCRSDVCCRVARGRAWRPWTWTWTWARTRARAASASIIVASSPVKSRQAHD